MSPMVKGLLVGGLQLAFILCIAGKYYADREALPRAWVLTAPVDPNLPIRGRYVSLRVRPKVVGTVRGPSESVQLSAENGELIASLADVDTGVTLWSPRSTQAAALWDPIAFFIPEHVPDPSRREKGEELWAEVSVPKHGPPRPLRLGVKKDGKIKPLQFN